MAKILNKTSVIASEEWEEEQLRIVKGFKWLNIQWWETLSQRTLGKDIHITTEDDIRNIYVNGKIYKLMNN